MTGQARRAGRAILKDLAGTVLACGFEFGTPGGAVLGEPSLQGAGADGQPAGDHFQRWFAVFECLRQCFTEVA